MVQNSTDMAQLTELTQSQAKRLEDMTALVAKLQKENHQLRMAASTSGSGTGTIPLDPMRPPNPVAHPGTSAGPGSNDPRSGTTKPSDVPPGPRNSSPG
jgi:hypothetical protein